MGVRWYPILVLICVSLMTSGAEHCFVSIGHVYVFFGEVSVFPLPIFYWIFLLLLSFASFLHILHLSDQALINHLSDMSIVNLFFHLVGCLFYFVEGFLHCAEAF